MACRRCKGDHFNFVSCEAHAEKQAASAARDKAPQRFLRPREGATDYGHRMTAHRVIGNRVVIPRKDHPALVERDCWAPEGGDIVYPKFGDE